MRWMPLLFLVACGGSPGGEASDTPSGDAYADCGATAYEQILSDDVADLELPQGQEGSLEDVLIGVWQNVYNYTPSDAYPLYPLSTESFDTRYAIPDLDTFVYCQDVAMGGDGVNTSDLTLEGNKLRIAGPGYTATWWNNDVMLWRNDYFDDDQYYVLVRMD